jgi:hypothetical protein
VAAEVVFRAVQLHVYQLSIMEALLDKQVQLDILPGCTDKFG